MVLEGQFNFYEFELNQYPTLRYAMNGELQTPTVIMGDADSRNFVAHARASTG